MVKTVYWACPDAEVRKTWPAFGIRYPGSPRRKRCLLGCGGSDTFTVEAKVLSRLTWREYGRKAKTQRN